MNRYKFVLSLATAWATILPLAVRAQDTDSADTFYGEGVEEYFAGCTTAADSFLSQSIAINPNDPRAFYFRAFSRIQQGRQDEARVDMQIGAELEARYPNRFEIGHTLQRIQGPSRLLLEQYRMSARVAAGTNPPAGPVKSPDTAVLRERRVVPLEEFSRAGEPHSTAAPDVPEAIANPPAVSAAKPAEDLNPAPSASASPFNDDVPAEPAPKPQPKPPAAKAPAPAAPKPIPPAPKPSDDKDDNPF